MRNASSAAAHSAPEAKASRSGAKTIWLALLAAAIIVALLAVVGAATRTHDRGVRGPADQGAPDAPKDEKVPPSAAR
jgi:hypothetical protein